MAVNVITNRNTYRIRFTHAGTRYTINHGTVGNKTHKSLMESIAAQVTLDISLGQLDTTLAKYKPWAVPEPEPIFETPLTPLHYWDEWVQILAGHGLSATSIRTRYQPIRRFIVAMPWEINTVSSERLIRLISEGVSPSTFNGRLAILKKWDKWLHDAKGLSWMSFDSYSSKRTEQREKPKPFTKDELAIIQRTAQQDARFTHYSMFIRFLIGTGCRPSEVIGLRWEDVNFELGVVTISSSLRRADDGSASGKNRVRDKTKTGNARVIPLSDKLLDGLRSHYEWCVRLRKGDDILVFIGVNGEPVNDEYFRKHIWKPLLKECGISYQRPYVLRHTLISHLIESGASLVQAAAIAGHKDTTMVSRVYGHMVNLPNMPEL